MGPVLLQDIAKLVPGLERLILKILNALTAALERVQDDESDYITLVLT